MDDYIKFIKWMIQTSIFGAVVGFIFGKFGSWWDERQKDKRDGFLLLRNLLQEISNNRFKCQGIIRGNDPVYFETFSWDRLRLSKYFSFLEVNKYLIESVYNLYLSIHAGNIRVGVSLVALDSQIRNLNQGAAISMSQGAFVVLKDYLKDDLLAKLDVTEGEMRRFLRENKIMK